MILQLALAAALIGTIMFVVVSAIFVLPEVLR